MDDQFRYLTNETKDKLLDLIRRPRPTSSKPPARPPSGRQVVHVLMDDDAGSSGSDEGHQYGFPCVYDPVSRVWTSYARSRVVSPNGEVLEAGRRYRAYAAGIVLDDWRTFMTRSITRAAGRRHDDGDHVAEAEGEITGIYASGCGIEYDQGGEVRFVGLGACCDCRPPVDLNCSEYDVANFMQVMDGTGEFAGYADPLNPHYPLSTDGGFTMPIYDESGFRQIVIAGAYGCVPFASGEGDGTPCLAIGSMLHYDFTGVGTPWEDPETFKASNCNPSVNGSSTIEVVAEGITRDGDGLFVSASFLLRTIRGNLRFRFSAA